MNDELFVRVAERFKALGEPARLRILDALRGGELTVGELVAATGLNQANLSKHLQLLHSVGFVARRKEGLFVVYQLADDDVFQLCDVMCGRVVHARRAAMIGRPPRSRSAARPSRAQQTT